MLTNMGFTNTIIIIVKTINFIIKMTLKSIIIAIQETFNTITLRKFSRISVESVRFFFNKNVFFLPKSLIVCFFC